MIPPNTPREHDAPEREQIGAARRQTGGHTTGVELVVVAGHGPDRTARGRR